MPFELKVVLSTNLDPAQLGDEAFFRRIHNKIYIGAVNDEQFDWILARVADKSGLGCSAEASERLRALAKARGDGELRAYLPGVVCELATAICLYENIGFVLSPELVDRVLDLYFTRATAGADKGDGGSATPAPTPADGGQRPVASALASVGSILAQANSGRG